MHTTAQDWAVTAAQEIDRCIENFTLARTAELEQMDDVLRSCWVAYQAAAAAMGALIESELRTGRDLAGVTRLLGFLTPDQADRALTPLRAAAAARLDARLSGA
jgi:hypothetical protein